METFLFLLEITLDGGGHWNCFRQSSAEATGLILFGAFMIIVVIMLLNTLIAMMAETFTNVSGASFKNYAFSFGKVPRRARRHPTPCHHHHRHSLSSSLPSR